MEAQWMLLRTDTQNRVNGLNSLGVSTVQLGGVVDRFSFPTCRSGAIFGS